MSCERIFLSFSAIAVSWGLLSVQSLQGGNSNDTQLTSKAKESTLDHWSFKPLIRPSVPRVVNGQWPGNAIDAFILAKLKNQGVRPAPEADRRTLIRRLCLDLLGLPPDPSRVRIFLEDDQPDAYVRLVDRLLASPHFGERWGRHWLDLARYADSDGYEDDRHRPNAWRYRDWVIDAINRDLLFNRFTIEQLAGDLLPAASEQQRIGTGFLRNSLLNEAANDADNEEFRVKAAKDRASTMGTVWLGLTIACCECHDHKYDPLTQREYYGLYAFFNDVDDVDLKLPDGIARVVQAAQRESRLHVRGNFLHRSERVEPHTPGRLSVFRKSGPRGDRLDLAHWLFEPAHPLTARVAANRYWQHLFGRGLIATPEDFGVQSEPPTHPQLLDWLATEFRRGKWSRKKLIHTIITSATYRQSSHHRPELVKNDPENELVSRQNRFRVEAEIVADLSLAVSGLLQDRMGGPPHQPPFPAGLAVAVLKREKLLEPSRGSDRHRRGVYVNVQRTFPHPMLMAFDVADANQTCTRRERSNTPIQALSLLNGPGAMDCASALALRLLNNHQKIDDLIRYGFELCLSRPPGHLERQLLMDLFNDLRHLYETNPSTADQLVGGAVSGKTSVAEHAAWIGVARTLLNQEEFITRE